MNASISTTKVLSRMDLTSDKITEALFVKHTFEESESCVTLQVYLLDTPSTSDAVRICCTDTLLRVDFSNNSQLNDSCRTWSRWLVTLRGRIIPERSSFKLLPNRSRVNTQRWSVRLEIQLKKEEAVKWVNLEANKTATDVKPPAQDSQWYTLTNEPASTAARSVTNSPKRPEAAARSTGSNAKANANASSKSVAKKPFCLVSPNNAQTTTFAGYTGIENFKNSCFMNAVLQVLANTRSVRDFAAQFDTESDGERVSKKARADLKAERLMPSTERERKVAARGELVRELCTIVNELWTGMQAHVTPARFKALFCARFAQFAGNLQQDSHEFLTFLLDGIRDELTNRVLPELSKTCVASDSASNGAVPVPVPGESGEPTGCDAESAPSNGFSTNGSMSFLQAFLGELRSEICCLECEHVSTRRDTFFCLSVPVPKPATRVRVHFMSYLATERPRPLEIELPASSDERAPCALNVLRQVATVVRCRVQDLRMYEVHQGRFHRLFTPHSALDELAPGDQLVVQQVVGPDANAEPDAEAEVELLVTQRVLMPNAQIDVCSFCQRSCADVQAVMKKCTRCYRVAYCSRECQLKHYDEHESWCRYVPALVGCPFILSVPRSRVTFDYLYERMRQFALWSVNVTYRSPPAIAHTPRAPATAEDLPHANGHLPELLSPSAEDTQPRFPNQSDLACTDDEISPDGIRRKFMFFIKQANEHGLETGRTLTPSATGHTPLDLTGWKHVYMDWLNKERNKPYVIVESKPSLGADPNAENPPEDPERAPSIKTSASVYDCLSSFTECEMLHAAEAWRCPRCDHLQAASKQLIISRAPEILVVHLKRFKPNREKLDALVDFPILALDISKFVVREEDSQTRAGTNGNSDGSQCEFIYDLYATVNHFGVTTGGHYTAYARLVDSFDSTRSEFGWREFDDLNVKVLHDVNMVRSRHAYLLFYKRRSQPPSTVAE